MVINTNSFDLSYFSPFFMLLFLSYITEKYIPNIICRLIVINKPIIVYYLMATSWAVFQGKRRILCDFVLARFNNIISVYIIKMNL